MKKISVFTTVLLLFLINNTIYADDYDCYSDRLNNAIILSDTSSIIGVLDKLDASQRKIVLSSTGVANEPLIKAIEIGDEKVINTLLRFGAIDYTRYPVIYEIGRAHV